ncbi:MAG: hypothetical protein GY708_29225, partial [Actinomycetia bacterium]|nr:hypothetical protein [Actinomycetes bacterium]
MEPTGRLADLSRESNDYWRNRPTIVWAQSTSLGVDTFEDDDDLVVWATDLRTGEPLAGVEIDLAGSVANVATDRDGIARTLKPSGRSQFEYHLTASLGSDSAIVPWVGNQQNQTDQSVWYVFDDRQMYRPGETAHIKGWVRRLTVSDDAQLAAVHNSAATYQAHDWYGNEIGSGTVDLSALGGFD